MNAGLLVIAGLGGYIVYDKLKQTPANTGTAKQTSGNNTWPSWLNIGNQPATGNGGNPTETAGAVAGAVAAVANFGTSLAQFFGTASSSDSYASGGSADLHGFDEDK